MRKILITGANSYIGTSVEKWLMRQPDKYLVDTVDMQNPKWREKDFTGYDVVFHVAGIAHSNNRKISKEKEKLYYSVNTDLTSETAIKAKKEGVKQFIYMSSAIVYGDSAPIGKQKIITKETIPQPSNVYGNSKLQGENGILPLQNDDFNVVVLRPPMIYGKGCKGNYQMLVKFALKLPVFPYVKNERSMLYIDNLCEFIRFIIDKNEQGVFWPQNSEYTNTSEMVKMIADVHCKKLKLIKGLTWLLALMSYLTGVVNKAFGNLTYHSSLCLNNLDFYDLKKSIELTESINE